jgi:hypothetical protein
MAMNGSFPLYVYVILLLSPTRLLPDLTMSKRGCYRILYLHMSYVFCTTLKYTKEKDKRARKNGQSRVMGQHWTQDTEWNNQNKAKQNTIQKTMINTDPPSYILVLYKTRMTYEDIKSYIVHINWFFVMNIELSMMENI